MNSPHAQYEPGQRAISFAVAAVILASALLGWAAPPDLAQGAGLPLEASASMVNPRLGPGDSPAIRYTLTNRGAPCTVVTDSAYAIRIASLTRDQASISPSVARATLIDGYDVAVGASARTLGTGES